MKSFASRRRAPKRSTILAVVAASVAFHAAVIFAIRVHWFAPKSKPPGKKAAASALEYSCPADATLGAAARLGYCLTPFAADPTCAGDTLAQYRNDLIICQGKNQSVALAKSNLTVALINPKQLAKLKPQKLAKLEPKQLPKPKPKPKSLVPIPPSPPRQARRPPQPKEIAKKQKKLARRKRPPPRPNHQVVEITPPKQQSQPNHARYLSSYNSRVKQETVARGSTEKMVARPGPKHLATTRSHPNEHARRPDTARGPMQQPQPKGNPNFDRGKGHGKNSQLAMRTPRSDKAPGNLDGFQRLAMNGTAPRRGKGGLTRERRAQSRRRRAHQGGGRGSLFRRMAPGNLRPSQKLLNRLAGGGSVDDLDGVKRGQITALNTKEWKFATFFNRLKRQVAQNWHPAQVYMERDPTGRIYGTKDRITIVRVSLNPNGSLRQVYVVRGSGVDFLDNEAVRAFRAAQPFPHPPSALVDARSHLITFSFGFHFVINGDGGHWNIFRYR